MKSRTVVHLAAAAGLLALGACSESTSPSASLIDQTTLTTDVASSSGDAIAADVQVVSTDEGFAGLAAPIDLAPATDSVSYTRVRTCYDSTGTSTACGTSAVRKAALFVSFSWARHDTAANGAVFLGAVKRVAYDTLFRNYTGTTETSRTHDGVSTGTDTTSFAGPTSPAPTMRRAATRSTRSPTTCRAAATRGRSRARSCAPSRCTPRSRAPRGPTRPT